MPVSTRPPFALAFAVALAACQSYSVEDYWRDLATAHCQRMRVCCTPAEYDDWWTGSLGTQDCQSVWEHPPNSGDIGNAVDDGRIDFDPKAAHAGIAALTARACAEFEPAVRYRETYCESPLRGLVRDGDPCAIDEECASKRCLVDPADRQRRGACTPAIAHGGSCTFATGGCQRPETCQDDDTCGLGEPAGVACSSDFDCIDHWCKGAGLFNPGTCVRACDGY